MPSHSTHKWPVIINNVKMSVEPSQHNSIHLDAIKSCKWLLHCFKGSILKRHLQIEEKIYLLRGIEIYDEMSIKFDFMKSISHKNQLSSSLLLLVRSVLGLETKCSINNFCFLPLPWFFFPYHSRISVFWNALRKHSQTKTSESPNVHICHWFMVWKKGPTFKWKSSKE